MRGTTMINIGEKERPIKFGTNQTAEYCQVRGLTLAQYQAELSSVEAMGVDVVRDLLYSALFAGCKAQKIDVDFDRYDVGEWLDDMDQAELDKAFQTLADSNKSGDEAGEVESGKK